MVILRPTRKLMRHLRPVGISSTSDTALGDWYVNRLVVDRQPLLLFVSALSLLSIVQPARDVRALPDRLHALVRERLKRLGTGAKVIDAEVGAMTPVAVAPTVDRSVVGIMVDFAKAIPSYLPAGVWDERALSVVEARLAETPCHAARPFEEVVFPERKAPALLVARWHAV